MRVALLHDWLTGMRGGERVLELMCKMYPDAEIFTLLAFPESVSPEIQKRRITTSVLQHLPFIRRSYRYYLPFFPLVVGELSRKLGLRHQEQPFDLVISISHCAVKNVKAPEGVPHLCYCLTPMRYIWDQYDAYFAGSKMEPLVRLFLGYLRRWDKSGARNPHRLVAISNFIKRRIASVYDIDVPVVYPPVDSAWFQGSSADNSGSVASLRKTTDESSVENSRAERPFICVSALVPYKNVDIIISAFNELDHHLIVVGSGPEGSYLRSIAKSNITFIPHLSDGELWELYHKARALVFAAEEDFGLVPVEAQRAGCPVIAYGKGGVLETVSDVEGEESGVFFGNLTSQALSDAIRDFLEREDCFRLDKCIKQSRKFDVENFTKEIGEFADELVRFK